MPIFPHHQIVHIHVPKTAGTSISRGLAAGGTMELDGAIRSPKRWFELQHLTSHEIDVNTNRRCAAWRRLAVVRNPYQRLISDYLWRQAIASSYPSDAIPVFDHFADFLSAIPIDIDSTWTDRIERADRAEANLLIHARPQVHYLTDAHGQADSRITRLAAETLRSDLASTLQSWGRSPIDVGDLPQRELSDYFSDDLIRLANEMYACDFEQLGYQMLTAIDP